MGGERERATPTGIRLRSLGHCSIEVGDAKLGPQQELVFGLLLYLLLERDRGVTKAELLNVFWESSAPARALHSLRQALYKLRRLGVDLDSRDGLITIAHEAIELDFEHASEILGRAAARPAALPSGRFLPGYEPHIGANFDQWLEVKRDSIHASVIRALLNSQHGYRARGDWEMAARAARACLAIDPLNEEATLVLAEATALLGSKARATRVLEDFMREVGAPSSPLTLSARVLHKRIAALSAPGGERTPAPMLVGREAEMERCHSHLTLAHAGHGATLLVTGDEGVGKTRFCTELLRLAQLEGCWTAVAQCTPTDRSRPFSAFADLSPRLIAAPGGIGASPDALSALTLLTADASHSSGATPVDPERMAGAVRRAFADLLAAVASERMVVLFIDDAHWLDEQSWQLLREVAPTVPRLRTLLIFAGRNATSLTDASGIAMSDPFHIPLGSLQPVCTSHLAKLLLASEGKVASDEAIKWMVSASGGIPLLLTELVRHYRPSVSPSELPRSYVDLVSKRLHRLSPPALRALQVISLIEAGCSLGTLEAILTRVEGLAATPLLVPSLSELEAHGMVDWTGGLLRPSSRALGDTAYGLLQPIVLASLHHCIATVLEEQDRSNTGGSAWTCAHHWKLAGSSGRAVALLRSCAKAAIAVGAVGEAVGALERALEITEASSMRVSLLTDLATVLQSAGRVKRALPVFRAIHQLRGSAPAHERHDDIEIMGLDTRWKAGECLRDLASDSLECVRAEQASATHRIRAATAALMYADNLFDPTIASTVEAELRQPLRDPGADPLATHHYLLVYHSVHGNVDVAVQLARTLAESDWIANAGDRQPAILCNLTVPLVLAGHLSEARMLCERAYMVATSKRMPSALSFAAYRLQQLAFAQGDLATSEYWAGQFSKLGDDEQDIITANHCTAWARIAILRRDFEAAEMNVREGMRRSERNAGDRARLYATAILCRIQLEREPSALSEPDLQLLIEGHMRGRAFAVHDYVFETLYLALCRANRRSEADHLYREYVTVYRRERSPIPPSLARIVESAHS